jgi:ppGpp synthetase/RelA/SpoT-type nucleotidyltranferase
MQSAPREHGKPSDPRPNDRPNVGRNNGSDQAAPVRQAVQTYAALHPELRRATEDFIALVTSLLDDAGINYLTVNGRAKSVASFAAKAVREAGGQPVYADPLAEITDQIGLRVITYLRDDVGAVAGLLSDQFTVLDDRDMGQETAADGRWGYASRHMVVAVDPARPEAPREALRGRVASVQVRTVLQHAWAEFEHDIRYKGTVPHQHVPDLDRRFTLAAGLLELADREFSAIRDRVRASLSERRHASDASDPRISPEELTTFLAGKYAEAGWSRTDHYAWISGLLLELGITTLEELDALLDSVDSDVVHEQMGYRYPAGAVRRLDDALLAVFGEPYLGLDGNAHRVAQLSARLEKLRALPPSR